MKKYPLIYLKEKLKNIYRVDISHPYDGELDEEPSDCGEWVRYTDVEELIDEIIAKVSDNEGT